MKLGHERWIDLAWLLLALMTLAGAWFGEAGDSGVAVTVFVAAVIAVKGRLVIDHFMELPGANVRIYRLMKLYFVVMPLLVVAVGLFGGVLARLTLL